MVRGGKFKCKYRNYGKPRHKVVDLWEYEANEYKHSPWYNKNTEKVLAATGDNSN